jgi:hypothetical protein
MLFAAVERREYYEKNLAKELLKLLKAAAQSERSCFSISK